MTRICVIGAGSAGLAALRGLRDAGNEVVGIERSSTVGGLWNDGYDSLHLITAKDLCSFEGYPLPDDYPLFPHRDQIVAYMNGYADHFGLRELIRFATTVERIEPIGEAGLGGWRVADGDGVTEDYDQVVIANGHLADPVLPEIPGTFTGKVMHAHDYRNTDDFEGDRILVIGAGNSGCDIAVDAAQSRFSTSICIRKGIIFQPKTLLGRGRTSLAPAFLPATVKEWLMRASIRLAIGRPSDYPGLSDPEETNLYRGQSVVNTQLLHWLHHGRVEVVPGIRRFDGKSVEFADGTRREYDTVVYATGYRISMPFLDSSLLTWKDGEPVRYAGGTLFPRLANLHVVGLIGPTGAQWPAYDRQAKMVARLVALQASRPDVVVADEMARLERPWETVNSPRHAWERASEASERAIGRLERRWGVSAPAGTRFVERHKEGASL